MAWYRPNAPQRRPPRCIRRPSRRVRSKSQMESEKPDRRTLNVNMAKPGNGFWPTLVHNTAEYQRGIRAAEAERIRQRHIDLALLRVMRHQIDRRLDRRIVEIDGRRYDAVTHRQNGEDGFDRARRAQQVPDRGFGRGHAHAASSIADQPMHGTELDLVPERRRGAV